MANSQFRSKRKVSGGRYHSSRSKRKYELAKFPANTKIAETKSKTKRTLGGNNKRALLSVKQMSVADGKGKTQKTEIVNVIENPANPNLVRRNILTKGAIVETKLGKAKITSRPGQEGSVNGILL
jgi:small subunit ribosomal protein S8e